MKVSLCSAVFACALGFLGSLLPSSAQAATFTVSNNNDAGAGSFRQAIQDAAAGDTINFASNVTGAITLTSGQLLVNKPLVISGPGPNLLTVHGNNSSRVIEIRSGALSISGLTIAGGTVLGTNGVNASSGSAGSGQAVLAAGVWNRSSLTMTNCVLRDHSLLGGSGGAGLGSAQGGHGGGAFGGALRNDGIAALVDCLFENNVARGGRGGASVTNLSGAGGAAGGAGIYTGPNSMTLLRCTFVANSSLAGDSGNVTNTYSPGSAGGGAIRNLGNLLVENCTFTGNRAENTGSNPDTGGGIDNLGLLTMRSSTLVSNIAGAFGGGLANYPFGATSIVQNTVIAANAATFHPDLTGEFVSLGFNLIGATNGSIGFTNAVNYDQAGTRTTPLNPLFGPLQNNGGPTLTMRPLAGSPAIDRGHSSGLTTDQRGRSRPFDDPALANAVGSDGSDIGAVELGGSGTVFVINTQDSGPGSLRNAVAGSDTANGDTILFAPALSGTIVLTSGELAISRSITIEGPGAKALTVSGNNSSRVFNIAGGPVSISGLTIANARGNPGGGVLSSGVATFRDCVIAGNSAPAVPGGGFPGAGGGILNGSLGNPVTLTLDGCTVSGNGSEFGGGVHNSTYGTMIIRNSTISGNIGSYSGGGIFNAGALTVINSTIVSNTAPQGGGIRGASATVGACLIAGNTAGTSPDVEGSFNSTGHNLVGKADGSGGFTHGLNGDQVGSIAAPLDPLLGPLQDNGGSTPTHALLWGSPAIDQGRSFGSTTDQRGAPRPFDFAAIPSASGGDASDIGALEVGSPHLDILPLGADVILSWPACYGGLTLQSMADLGANNWGAVSNPPTVSGSRFNVIDPAAGVSKTYRLRSN